MWQCLTVDRACRERCQNFVTHCDNAKMFVTIATGVCRGTRGQVGTERHQLNWPTQNLQDLWAW